MFTPRRHIGLRCGEDVARVRRVTRGVMDAIGLERQWSDPFEKIAVYGAVDVWVTASVRRGETNEDVLKAGALEAVRAGPEQFL